MLQMIYQHIVDWNIIDPSLWYLIRSSIASNVVENDSNGFSNAIMSTSPMNYDFPWIHMNAEERLQYVGEKDVNVLIFNASYIKE